MCIKRFELVDGQFKHNRHWLINIPFTGWSKTFMDLIVNNIYWLRQWYMYTCLTGTLERWINNHRSITETWNLQLGIFFFSIKKYMTKRLIKNWSQHPLNSCKHTKQKFRFKTEGIPISWHILYSSSDPFIITSDNFSPMIFSLFLVILKTFIYVKWGCGGWCCLLQ